MTISSAPSRLIIASRESRLARGQAELVQKLLNWLTQIALWGSLASILCGAAIYGLSQQTGNYSGGYLGKRLALAGAIGACLAGIAPTAINLLFKAAK